MNLKEKWVNNCIHECSDCPWGDTDHTIESCMMNYAHDQGIKDFAKALLVEDVVDASVIRKMADEMLMC